MSPFSCLGYNSFHLMKYFEINKFELSAFDIVALRSLVNITTMDSLCITMDTWCLPRRMLPFYSPLSSPRFVVLKHHWSLPALVVMHMYILMKNTLNLTNAEFTAIMIDLQNALWLPIMDYILVRHLRAWRHYSYYSGTIYISVKWHENHNY